MRPERTWYDVLQRLRGRDKTLSGRVLLPIEKQILAMLINKSHRRGLNYNSFAEALKCSVENVDQFFTGQSGLTLTNAVQYCIVIGCELQVNIRDTKKGEV